MDNELGMKELYEVVLKTTYPIEVSGKRIEIGETVARFDKIQLANFAEKKEFTAARGGYENAPRVWWEETKEIGVTIMQGVFSASQLAVMSNANLVSVQEPILISCRETLETNENGEVILSHTAVDPSIAPVFVYSAKTGEKYNGLLVVENVINVGTPYEEVIVDYSYTYGDGYRNISLGDTLTNGYLSLEGKMRVKDDITGQVRTGIIKIPKLKLMSDLSIRLGNNTAPVVGKVNAVAVPDGRRGNKKVMEIIFLNDDIDSDM